MSAVEALAEVLDDAIWDLRIEGLSQYDIQRIVRVAAVPTLVAAIRSMPAEQVAELIDGVTEDHGSNVDPHTRLPLNVTHRRAVGPWLPLGVSPETNGEQK